MNEIPTKPYLLRALYEWCVDNGYTPHLAVKVDSRTQVPSEYVKNGEITLNVSPSAVHKLQMGNEVVEFAARFGGVARQISVPTGSVYALYARETGHGMTFDIEPLKTPVQGDVESAPVDPGSRIGPSVVRDPARGMYPVIPKRAPAEVPRTPEPSPEPPKPGGKPTLRRVK